MLLEYHLHLFCTYKRLIFTKKRRSMAHLSLEKPATSRKFIVSLVVCMMMILVPRTNANCAIEALFVFGDSNSDTGGYFAAFPPQPPPYGMTYFKKPSGRATNGRNYIDFLAQALGFPFISPYLQSIGSNYKHGANFATSSSTVLQPNGSVFVSGVSPFYLKVQIDQMKQFKARVEELKSQRHTNLPQPDVFGKSIYTFYIGQNDFTGYVGTAGAAGGKQIGPRIVPQIKGAIKELYGLGGRTFMVLNLAPIGCYPAYIVQFPHESSDIDSFGCMRSYNNAVDYYNSMLKKVVEQTRQELRDANIIYVDTHSLLRELYRHPKSHGMKYGTKACCGYGGGANNFDPRVFCGSTRVIDGRNVTSYACTDPQNYVNWDGIHYTEAADKMMANAILNGSLFDPPFSFSDHNCDIQPIG